MTPRVLTIAGSDSGGGAGIQADLKAMTAHGVYGLSVITAITSQNTLTVDAVQVVETAMVEKQFRAVMSDIGCDAVKTGMLANRSIVLKVVDLLLEFGRPKTVIDPVMVATTGARLLDRDAIEALFYKLLPLSYMLTPNIQEAKLLLAEARGVEISEIGEVGSVEKLQEMATELQKYGPRYVLIKGGHMPLNSDFKACGDDKSGAIVADVLCKPDGQTVVMTSAWSPSRNTHGTGCTLASAIASNLATGKDAEESVRAAISYVHGAILNSFDIGSGNGPLNHMYRLSALPFIPGHFVDYMINHATVQPHWRAYTEHSFVQQLSDGSLRLRAFKKFLRQDYLYLIHYARLHALAAYKCENLDDITGSAEIILHIRQELNLHFEYCEGFGITRKELEEGEETVACTVYTRYIESIGTSRDWISLLVALTACLVGYGEVGKRLYEGAETNRQSRYWTWIKNYAEDDYSAAVTRGRALVEKHAVDQSPTKIAELVQIFKRVTEYEALFWTSALELDENERDDI